MTVSVYTMIGPTLSLFKIDTDDHHLAINTVKEEKDVNGLVLAFIRGGQYVKNSLLKAVKK